MEQLLAQMGIFDQSKSIESNDILQLLKDGLRQNQSFARYFADTVLSSIQRKIQSLDMSVSDIVIDGNALGQEIENEIRKGLDGTVESTVKKAKLQIEDAIIIEEDPVSIQSLLGVTPQNTAQVSSRFKDMTNDFLDKVDVMFKGNDQPEDLSMTSMFTPAGKEGRAYQADNKIASKKFVSLRGQLVKKADSLLQKFSNQKEITIADIFGIEKKSESAMVKWTGLEDTVRKKLTDKPAIRGEKEKKEVQTNKGFRTLEEKTPTVKIGGFTPEAMKELRKLPGLHKLDLKMPSKRLVDPKSGLPDWVKDLAVAGLALMAGGAVIGVHGLFDSGPLKGLKKVIARGAITAGRKFAGWAGMFIGRRMSFLTKYMKNYFDDIFKFLGGKLGTKMAGKIALKGGIGRKLTAMMFRMSRTLLGKGAAKKIPVIGALFGIGFGISRMLKGDYLGGLLDFASGIASMAPPGIGTAISIAIDLFQARRDIKGGGAAKLGQTSKFNKWWKEYATTKLKDNPVVRPFILISQAIGHFSTGDWKEGLKKLTFIIPGVESALGFFSSVKEKMDTKGGKGFTGKMKSLGEAIYEAIIEKIQNFYKGAPKWMKWIMRKIPGFSGILPKGEDEKETFKTPSEKEVQATQQDKPLNASNIRRERVKTPQKKKSEEMSDKEKAEQEKSPQEKKSEEMSDKIIKSKEKRLVQATKATETRKARNKALQKSKEETKINTEDKKAFETKLLKAKKREELKEQKRDEGLKKITKVKKVEQKTNKKPTIKGAPKETDLKKPIKKKDESADKIVNSLNKVSEKLNTKEDSTQHYDRMHKDMNELINQVKKSSAEKNMIPKSTPPQQQVGELAGIPEDAGSLRDPAYVLRTRAWDRIRKGYVVI